MLDTGKKFRNFFRFFFKFCFSNFFQLTESYKLLKGFFNLYYRSRVKIRNVKAVFRFSGFPGFPYINSLRKRGGKSKIRKISKLQKNTEIALVDGFWWNLCQMEALGLVFWKKLKFWIFDYFPMIYSTLNIGQIQIFENYQKHRFNFQILRFSKYSLNKFI